MLLKALSPLEVKFAFFIQRHAMGTYRRVGVHKKAENTRHLNLGWNSDKWGHYIPTSTWLSEGELWIARVSLQSKDCESENSYEFWHICFPRAFPFVLCPFKLRRCVIWQSHSHTIHCAGTYRKCRCMQLSVKHTEDVNKYRMYICLTNNVIIHS